MARHAFLKCPKLPIEEVCPLLQIEIQYSTTVYRILGTFRGHLDEVGRLQSRSFSTRLRFRNVFSIGDSWKRRLRMRNSNDPNLTGRIESETAENQTL